MSSPVTDNVEHNRFELCENGHVAFAEYRRHGAVILLPHVEAPLALRGSGAAGRLMEGIVALARREGWKIRPICPYAAAYLERHAEHADLLADP